MERGLFSIGVVIMQTCVPPAKWDKYSSGGTVGTFGNPDVKDPVQGIYLENCSLIAGLASLAWKGKIGVQPGPAYAFKFYRKDPNNNTIEETQNTDEILPLNAMGKLMHAKSDTPTEIWPALYEKAFYQWLDKLGLTNVSARPDYCQHTEWQSPVTVLFQLTGKEVRQKSCPDWDTVFNDIDGFCTNCGRSTTNRAINYAAVAWTYDPNANIPTGAVYSDTTIIGKHSYSLLGVVKLGTAFEQKFVVLRNPYGIGKGDPKMDGLYTGALWCNNINFGDADGIFALRIDLFVKYFAGYAWAV